MAAKLAVVAHTTHASMPNPTAMTASAGNGSPSSARAGQVSTLCDPSQACPCCEAVQARTRACTSPGSTDCDWKTTMNAVATSAPVTWATR